MKWNKERQSYLFSVVMVSLFMILGKQSGIITLSWFWVLSPLWVQPAMYCFLSFICYLIMRFGKDF